LAPNSKRKIDPKNEAIFGFAYETIEAVFQKLKLKMTSVKRATNYPKRKEMLRHRTRRCAINLRSFSFPQHPISKFGGKGIT